MPIFEIFSQREKKRRGEVPDVYQYETIPNKLRIQVIHIWYDAFGEVFRNNFGDLEYSHAAVDAYKFIHDTLCHEYGTFTLLEDDDSDDFPDYTAVYNFFLKTQDAEKVIDVIEVSFHYINQYASNISSEEAIADLNHRFQQHGIGYQFESGQMIRIDSAFIHSEAVKPSLSMLSDPIYEGANDEFLRAHEHYRNGRHKECMNECLKAFESCIKSICDARGWNHSNQNGIRLIKIVFDEELIPTFMQSHFTALKSTLEAVPTARNQRSGHGQGSKIIPVPEYMSAYALHLTASNILFLAKANDEFIPF